LYVLGLNAYHGDASAAILRDGELLAAVEEERFTRVKHTAGFPSNAVRYCLEVAGIPVEAVDHVVVPRKRSAQLLKKAIWAARFPRFALSRANAWRSFGGVQDALAEAGGTTPAKLTAQLHFVEHHVAHAASAYYCSPFDEAAVLSLDGLGDFASMLWGTASGRDIEVGGRVMFPHSLGLYYTAVTQYLGFPRYGDEYKVMGLAPYGEPRYGDVFDRIVRSDGKLGFKLGMDYFRHQKVGPEVSWRSGEPTMPTLFGNGLVDALGPVREPSEPLNQHHYDVAATLQERLETIVYGIVGELASRTKSKNLAYAGGVAFNCVANGRILDRTPFENLYVQPAAGDAGLAVGGAMYTYHSILGQPRTGFVMDHAYWGPEYPVARMKAALETEGLAFEELSDDEMASAAAKRIADGDVLGWYQGRSEWGPRALGNRSIVVDPRRADMKDILNSRVKHREAFRPFSPSILAERVGEWFENDYPSPFMQMTYQVREDKRDAIPAPTHVDGSGRLQTVTEEANPRYHALITEFEKLTGVPVLLNTSFNDNEPVVNTPEEAVASFLRTRMDVLALGPFLAVRQ
jgi:carbamoyltransferase